MNWVQSTIVWIEFQQRGPLIQISQVQAIFNKVGQLVSIFGKIKWINCIKLVLNILDFFFGLLHEGVDNKLEELSGLNLVNRDSVKRLVKEYLYPEYQILQYQPNSELKKVWDLD